MAVPKVIWALWLQGWDSAPDLLRACAASWVRLNPRWEFRPLTRAHVVQLLSAGPNAHLLQSGVAPAALSDVVRIELLARHGGVWVDATTYCLLPLDEWLERAAASGFFAFERPGPDRMLSTWFLASAMPASPVILRWLDRIRAYWAGRTAPDAYFWCHHLFERAYETDDEVRRVWNATHKISADGPHAFVPYPKSLLGPVTEKARSVVEHPRTPLLKLTHRVRPAPGDGFTLYGWLCERERGGGTLADG